jgi:uncharacterized repeat protein (TIGR02543 family)
MKFNNPFKTQTNLIFRLLQKFRMLLIIVLLGITSQGIAQSTKEFINGSDTLIVYSDVPGLNQYVPRIDSLDTQDIRVISDKYTIRVRSAATNNEWVDVFAHYTYNRGFELPKLPLIETGSPHSTNTQHYPDFTRGWSHTFGNIEMSNNQPVEVEIAAKNGFQIKNQDFFKAAVHPAQKASAATVVDGKVYFTINNPAQVVIDINGQMDDHNELINPIGHPLHAITLFTNPVLKKPSLNGSRTFYVENGQMPTVSHTTYDTLYFKPGVHDIGINNKIFPGKVYYIPGDAIVFGTLNNLNVPQGNFQSIGDRIKFTGYGTISGVRTRHPRYIPNAEITNHYKPIMIDKARDYEIYGVTVVDPANHSVFIPSGQNGYVLWAKVIAWRANGDGLAGNLHVNDCFMRTSDDASYARGNRKRCTFWKDHISGVFYMAQIPGNQQFLIEDCDVVYLRSRSSDGTNGGLWHVRGDGTKGVNNVDITFRDIRVHDVRSNMCIFNMVSYKGTSSAPTQVGSSYNGVLFQNISIASSLVKQRIFGCEEAPWYGGVTFDNVTFAGVKLTEENFNAYFDTNEFVKDLRFRIPGNFTITTNAVNGVINISPGKEEYNENEEVTLTAVPATGYIFTGWEGALSGTENPITMVMDEDKIVSANFEVFTGSQYSLSTTALNGTITLVPAGGSYAPGTVVIVSAVPNSGYMFTGWSGDLNGKSIETIITMDGNKEVTASFARGYGINLGAAEGTTYTSSEGLVYTGIPTSWSQNNANMEIAGTHDPELFRYWTAIPRNTSLSRTFSIPVENGTYWTTLMFREHDIDNVQPGKRVTQISYEDEVYHEAFDTWAAVGAINTALEIEDIVIVTDGVLNVSLRKVGEVWDDYPIFHAFKALEIDLEKDVYKLTALADNNGSIGLSPKGALHNGSNVNLKGTDVTVTAIPNEGYIFSEWGGDLSGTDNPVSITMNGNKEVTAFFTAIPTYTLSVTATNGSVAVSPDGDTHHEGTEITLTASPDAGYEFSGWSGDLSGTDNPASIIMDGNKEVTALFTLIPTYTLSITANNGTVSMDPSGGIYEPRTVVTLTAIPDEGYEFFAWGGDLNRTDNPTTIYMSGDKDVIAAFTLIPTFTLSIMADNGTVATDPSGDTYQEGTEVSLTATPDGGYEFSGWSGDLTGTNNPASITMDGSKEVIAEFTVITGLNSQFNNVSSQNTLGQNYPNPFSINTVIPYYLSESDHVRLTVYSFTGQQIAVLVNEFQSRGRYSYHWEAKDNNGNPLGKGLYLYRLETSNGIFSTKKLILK